MGSSSYLNKKSAKDNQQTSVKNLINWFEIPVLNFERALGFYSNIFDVEMNTSQAGDYTFGFFPNNSGISGAIVKGDGCHPSDTGPLLYLNASPDLKVVLDKVQPAGGRVILQKSLISQETGYFALFIDSEGNRLALHSHQ